MIKNLRGLCKMVGEGKKESFAYLKQSPLLNVGGGIKGE
jgi:hypothetical protein